MSAPRAARPSGPARRVAAGALAALLAWWIVRSPWQAACRAAGNVLFACLGLAGRARLVPAAPAGGPFTADSVLLLLDPGGGAAASVGVSFLRLGYAGLAVFGCLTFATWRPGPATRGRVLAGLASLVAYWCCCVVVLALHAGLRDPATGPAVPAPLAQAVVVAFRVLVNPAGFVELVVPAFLWFATVGGAVRGRAAAGESGREPPGYPRCTSQTPPRITAAPQK